MPVPTLRTRDAAPNVTEPGGGQRPSSIEVEQPEHLEQRGSERHASGSIASWGKGLVVWMQRHERGNYTRST
jgi:hypothetical protein